MRLKRLEIQGFKSFARPVCLEFGPGITAIVGPNGSGKSNISDALRWVMGEQSARSLRGFKMEDVIFAGSEGKKPLGMAEVQLTLDNSDGFLPLDYAEVTITRRVYRSGESEFLINKQPCRLRDIHDLFTDTGLGREGYSIIGQGQVDAVLSVRSEDRRVLLEETAGIVKYRQRKEQALRKLDETSVDLLRVTDILHELESQLGPLEEQAAQARRYLDLAERLKHAELDYFHLQWQRLDEKRAKNKETLHSLQAEYDACAGELGSAETEKNRLDQQLAALEEEIELLQQEALDLKEAFNQGLHTIELHQERLRSLDARSEQLAGLIRARGEELEQLAAEGGGLDQEVQALLERIGAQEKTIEAARHKARKLQEDYRETQTRVNEFKNEFFDFMRELADKRNFQRSFADREGSLKAQIAANQRELEQFQAKLAENAERMERLSADQAELAGRIREYQACGEEIQKKLEESKAALAEEQQAARHREGELARVRSRLKTLQELEEGYEGYAHGVRRIMQHDRMSQLALGTVADVVTVPPGLETAFEVALGSSLQNLITKGEEEAKTLIAWLKQIQGGRVTILPLDAMRGREFSAAERSRLKGEGVLGAALDLLTFAEEYRPALASLLGRAAITEDLDTARALKRELGQFSRIVTRDGSVVFPSGAMTGGSLNSRTSGLLARKGQLAQLAEEAASLEEELRLHEERTAALAAAIASLEEEGSRLQREAVEARLEEERIKQARDQALYEERVLLANREQLEDKNRELEAVLENLAAESETAAARVVELEEEEKLRRGQISEAEALLDELAAAAEEAAREETARQVQLAELKGVLENQRILLAGLEQRKETARKAREEAEAELAAIAEEKVLSEQAVAAAAAENEVRQAKQADLQLVIAEKKQLRQEVQQEQSRLGAELIQIEKEQLKRERALYKCEVEQEQLQREQEQILAALGERELSLESVRGREVSVKEGTLKRQISDVRNEIRELGPVNPAATEEYERVLERVGFLQTQLADLNDARESLQDVINEMDKLCRTKLWDVFKQVQVEFGKIFNQLFLGGKAELVLTDPESILTTGIEVMARPPGKKLQNLLVLSGGERALTAIALLFAIRRVQPTPFCVLDEIDAALDESNLGRFVEVMEDFARQTQFLVVTHRPRTMEAADTLYGVTMGEEGISQIISVAIT